MKEKTVFMVVFVLVLGTFFTGLLVAVDDYTAPIVARNARVTMKKNILEALGTPFAEGDAEEVFARTVKVEKQKGESYYRTRGGVVAFPFEGPGLWGPISGVIALDTPEKTIRALTIIHEEETPGLGGRIEEKDFLDRFRNRDYLPRIEIVAPGTARAPNEIDGITAATMTSDALQAMLNEAVDKYRAAY